MPHLTHLGLHLLRSIRAGIRLQPRREEPALIVEEDVETTRDEHDVTPMTEAP